MGEFIISIFGHKPVPWGCKEWDWRQTIADAVREKAGNEKLQPGERPCFNVSLIFRLDQDHIRQPDLDNLAKPVLDTLFRPYRPQVKDMSLTGALFGVDDNSVFRLSVEKCQVSSGAEEGIDITVTW